MSANNRCFACKRGADTCRFCQGLPAEDVEAICDCGLVGFGAHLIACDITQDDLPDEEAK